MSFQYTILEDHRLILVRFQATVSISEFIVAASAICSNKRYVRGYDGLIDLTHVAISFSADKLKELVFFTMSKKKHGHGKWAALVNTPIATAFTMLYQRGVSEKHPFALFSTLEGASSFLGRPIDDEFMQKIPEK